MRWIGVGVGRDGGGGDVVGVGSVGGVGGVGSGSGDGGGGRVQGAEPECNARRPSCHEARRALIGVSV